MKGRLGKRVSFSLMRANTKVSIFKASSVFFGDKRAPQDRKGQVSIVKDSKVKDSIGQYSEGKKRKKRRIRKIFILSFIQSPSGKQILVTKKLPQRKLPQLKLVIINVYQYPVLSI